MTDYAREAGLSSINTGNKVTAGSRPKKTEMTNELTLMLTMSFYLELYLTVNVNYQPSLCHYTTQQSAQSLPLHRSHSHDVCRPGLNY